jgi:meiosis-specific protein HOP1
MMSLGDGHNSFSKHSGQNNEDPIAKAIKKGKPPTLRDVKLSVKVILSMLSFLRLILITFV